MIQRRPIRRFTGLVGLPPEPDEAEVRPAPALASTSEPIVSVTPPAPADLTCEYRLHGDQWFCVYCTHHASEDDMTASGIPAARVCSTQNIQKQNNAAEWKEFDKKIAERERRAAAARERRKKKVEQF